MFEFYLINLITKLFTISLAGSGVGIGVVFISLIKCTFRSTLFWVRSTLIKWRNKKLFTCNFFKEIQVFEDKLFKIAFVILFTSFTFYSIAFFLIFCNSDNTILVKFDNNLVAHVWFLLFIFLYLILLVIYFIRGINKKPKMAVTLFNFILHIWIAYKYSIPKTVWAIYKFEVRHTPDGFLINDIADFPGCRIVKKLDWETIHESVKKYVEHQTGISAEGICDFPLVVQDSYHQFINIDTELYFTQPFNFKNIHHNFAANMNQLSEIWNKYDSSHAAWFIEDLMAPVFFGLCFIIVNWILRRYSDYLHSFPGDDNDDIVPLPPANVAEWQPPFPDNVGVWLVPDNIDADFVDVYP